MEETVGNPETATVEEQQVELDGNLPFAAVAFKGKIEQQISGKAYFPIFFNYFPTIASFFPYNTSVCGSSFLHP